MMEKLHDNWITEGLIDFEYKKYLLLAYLKSVEKNFISNKIYPYLGDLVRHYQNLTTFLNNKNATSKAFPKQLSQIDLQNFILRYEDMIQDDALMAEIERILDFSIPVIKKQLEEGKEIYDWIENQLMIEPVGIQPLFQQAGYLFIRNGKEKDTKVYQYQLSIFQDANENYRGIMTKYVSTFTAGITQTYESFKLKLIERQKLLIAPAVYLIASDLRLPLGETLLPIARRVLVRHLSSL